MNARSIQDRRVPSRAAIHAVVTLVGILCRAAFASAQDFAPPAPVGPAAGAAALLERALPAAADRLSLEGVTVRWLGLPDLETRAASLLVPAGSVRAALGVSQTGDAALGWTALALAVGAAADGAGFGLRVVARRDRAGGALLTSAPALGSGVEAGAGGWLALAPHWCLWAQAPQLWVSGEPPPLSRPLELGARCESGPLAGWLALIAPGDGTDGERVGGFAIARGALSVWAEARDGPLRPSVGLTAEAGPLRVAVRVEGHPVLGETSQLALALRRGPARSAP